MRKVSVHLTQPARLAARDGEARRRAVEAILARVDEPGDVEFLAFTSQGQRFALSARIVIEVDIFPHRAPNRVLRRTG